MSFKWHKRLDLKIIVKQIGKYYIQPQLHVVESTTARGRIRDDGLKTEFKTVEEEAKKTGFAGEIKVASEGRSNKSGEYGHEIFVIDEFGDIEEFEEINGTSSTQQIDLHYAGFTNWKRKYNKQNWEDIRKLIFEFVPQTKEKIEEDMLEIKKQHKYTCSTQLLKFIVDIAHSAEYAVYAWTHDNLMKLWNTKRHIPNVQYGDFEDLARLDRNHVTVDHICVTLPIRQTIGYFDGTKYVYIVFLNLNFTNI